MYHAICNQCNSNNNIIRHGEYTVSLYSWWLINELLLSLNVGIIVRFDLQLTQITETS